MNDRPDDFLRVVVSRTRLVGTFVYYLECRHQITTELEYARGRKMYCSVCDSHSPRAPMRANQLSEAARLFNVAALMAGQGNASGAIDKGRGAIAQLKLLSRGDTAQSAAGDPQRPLRWLQPPQRRRSDRE